MVRFIGGLIFLSTLSFAAPTDRATDNLLAQSERTVQQPLGVGTSARKLQGRFLHVTDFHPDPYYKIHSSPEGDHPCHSGGDPGRAGYYGAEITDCDSPFSLINATFDWLKENLRDKIDFVVWTGDSARHDNDEQYPRNDGLVIDLNNYVVNKFIEVFGKQDNIDDPDPTNDLIVPIIPTFGNNDILPHNIFEVGPNRWTRRYVNIWRKFIPQEQKHSFARGGWFFTEVIPNKLAVFSLNSLYFFDSNSAVDGCDIASEPGYEQMDWLRIQLQFLRQRRMKAIITGHVPPMRTENKNSWDESCYQKYTLWLRLYRDVVITSIWGHANIDCFMFQDTKDLRYKFKISDVDNDIQPGTTMERSHQNNSVSIFAKPVKYLNELRDIWSGLPTPPRGTSYSNLEIASTTNDDLLNNEKKKKSKKEKKMERFLKDIGGPWAERFSLSFVSPSVVPNYYPTLRVIEYNISGLENHSPAMSVIGRPAESTDLRFDDDTSREGESINLPVEFDPLHDLKKKKRKKKKKPKPNKPNFPMPRAPSKSSLPGPAYSPQELSLISYTQYYANITKSNEGAENTSGDSTKHPSMNHVKYRVEYTTNNDSAYRMKDLTVRSVLDVAERIGRSELHKQLNENIEYDVLGEYLEDDERQDPNRRTEVAHKKHLKNRLWRVFVKRAFVHTKPDEDLDDEFD